MTLTQLEYVLAVYKHKHFGRAAESCFVTQPTLSMQLQKLEDALQLTLFDRSKSPIGEVESVLTVIPALIGGLIRILAEATDKVCSHYPATGIASTIFEKVSHQAALAVTFSEDTQHSDSVSGVQQASPSPSADSELEKSCTSSIVL